MRFRTTKMGNVALWTLQGLLALMFVFAGMMKLIMPLDVLAQQSHMPGVFMKLIGVCEVAGALGLILPGLLRKARVLTPLAAAGLAIIMIGAVSLSAMSMGLAAAIVPFVVGVLDTLVVYPRWPRGGMHYSAPHPAE